MYLLDTNVVSDANKPSRDSHLESWLGQQPYEHLFISVVTIAEIRSGVERMHAGHRRDELEYWLSHDLPVRFRERIFPIDGEVGNICGRIMAKVHQDKVRAATNDIWIAAIALHHGMTIVTRNTRDFEGLGVPTINPWEFVG